MPSPYAVSEPAAGHVSAERAACRRAGESVIRTLRTLTNEDHRECLVRESARDGKR